MSGRAVGERRPRAAVPAAPPGVAVAIAAVLLAGATALALLNFALILQTTPPRRPVQETAVRSWAAALNAAAAGETGAMAEAVGPGFVLHRAGAPDLPAERLEALAAEIGRAVEGLRFVPDGVVSDGEWGAARLLVTGGERRVGGASIDGPPVVREFPVYFRLEESRLAEAWAPDFGEGLPRSLPPVSLPQWRSPTPVVLARIVIPPKADLGGLATSGIHLLLPETGMVEARVNGRALILHGASPGGWEVTPPDGKRLPLGPGDALLVTDGAFHSLENRGTAPASLLGFATVPYLAESGEGRIVPKTTPMPAIYGARPGAMVLLPGGVTSVTMARGLGGGVPAPAGTCAPGRWMTLEVTRATLAPGEALPAHEVRGVEVLETDRAAVPLGPWLAGDIEPSPAEAARRRNDLGLATSDRRAGELRNDRASPMALTAIRLTPEIDAACPPGSPVRTGLDGGTVGATPG